MSREPSAAPPPFRLPSTSPSAATLSNLTQWQALANAGVQRATASATTWRNGLAGFVTLLTSALVLKGSDLSAVAQPYRVVAVVSILGGASLAIAGLWKALAAEAPAEARASFGEIVERYGLISGYQQALAQESQRRLQSARRRVFWALVLLVLGIGAWWISPTQVASEQVMITWIDATGDHALCGELLSSAPGQIAVRSNSATDAVVIPAGSLTRIALADECPSS